MQINASLVKDRLLSNLEGVLAHLFPNGRVVGHEFRVGSVEGEAGKSLCVQLRGPDRGVWQDWSHPKGAKGQSGDVMALWCAARHQSFKEAFPAMKRFAGFTNVEPVERKPKPTPNTAGISLLTPAVHAYLCDRGISDHTLRKYRVRSHKRPVSPANPQSEVRDDFMLFAFLDSEGDPVMIKSTWIQQPEGRKNIWTSPPYYTLWGWWMVDDDAREMVITEGEICAMSLYQLNPGVPVLSLPGGVSNMDWIANDWEALQRFQRIYLVFDNDPPNEKTGLRPGEEGAREAAKRLGPARCLRVPVPGGHKDVNALLTSGDDTLLDWHARWLPHAYGFDPPTIAGVEAFRESAHAKLSRQRRMFEENDFIWPKIPFQFRDGECTVISGYPGSGKALAIDTPIPTPMGFRPLGSLCVGDKVFSPDGHSVEIAATTEIMSDHECFAITFSDGERIIADADHRWLTYTPPARGSYSRIQRRCRRSSGANDQRHKACLPCIVTTRDIAKTVKCALAGFEGRLNHAVFLASPFDQPGSLPIEPYRLGYWLGNGNSSSGRVTTNANDTSDVLATMGIEAESVRVTYHSDRLADDFTIPGMTTLLRQAGLLYNKHIPEIYLFGGLVQRRRLLAGLLDSDGYAAGGAKVEFVSMSERLANDVLTLIHSLGMRAAICTGIARLDGREIGVKYRISFAASYPVFLTSRKSAQLVPATGFHSRYRYIVTCEPVESVPVRCIQVNSSDGLFLCGKSFITTHNSALLYQTHAHEMWTGRKIFMVSFEIDPESMIIEIAHNLLGCVPGDSELDRAIDWMTGRLWFYRAQRRQRPSLLELLADCDYAVARFGCARIAVDSLHFLASKEDYEAQDNVSLQLTNFAKSREVHVSLICHSVVKKGEEIVPGLGMVEGSGGITKPIDNGITIWRNVRKQEALLKAQETEDSLKMQTAEKMHDAVMKFWKHRETGRLPVVKLWFSEPGKSFRLGRDDPIYAPLALPAPQNDGIKELF